MRSKILLTVLTPTGALAASLGYSLAQGGGHLGAILAVTLLLIICGFFISYKRK